VAALNRDAFAAGAMLMLAHDLRVMRSDTRKCARS
jgi:enoyl-CoA hydratase/carnithine racemase